MLQFPQASPNGRAAQPGDPGQPCDAATTTLEREGGRDQATSPFVGAGEELVQDGVSLGDSPPRGFIALRAGTMVRSLPVILRDHDELTPVKGASKKVSPL